MAADRNMYEWGLSDSGDVHNGAYMSSNRRSNGQIHGAPWSDDIVYCKLKGSQCGGGQGSK